MADKFQSPFRENYLEIDGIRVHYVDEGHGPPILMVHGNLEWSYLYRKMIPPLVDAGYRCVAPDLMGFGLSDKPPQESAYTLQKHVRLVSELAGQLGLHQLITVGGDWGGPISLRYAIEHQDNVSALVILGTGVRPMKAPLLFRMLFQSGGISSFLIKNLDVFRRTMYSRIGFKRPVDARVIEQYKMPHPTAASRAGMAAFPNMIPSHAGHPNWDYILEIERTIAEWNLPVLVMFADKDMVFKVEEGHRIANLVPNGRFHLIHNAGHFSPEDAGEEMAERLVLFLRDEAMIGR